MRKFSKKRGPRKLFVRNMAHNLIMAGKITTTEPRAKELKTRVEKLITMAKKQNLAALRILLSRLSKDSASKLYYDIAPKYKERHGGYFRILKLSSFRKRDGVKQVVIEFV